MHVKSYMKKNPIPIKCAEFNMFRRDIHAILGKIMVDVWKAKP